MVFEEVPPLFLRTRLNVVSSLRTFALVVRTRLVGMLILSVLRSKVKKVRAQMQSKRQRLHSLAECLITNEYMIDEAREKNFNSSRESLCRRGVQRIKKQINGFVNEWVGSWLCWGLTFISSKGDLTRMSRHRYILYSQLTLHQTN
jgi:hypothetical protein